MNLNLTHIFTPKCLPLFPSFMRTGNAISVNLRPLTFRYASYRSPEVFTSEYRCESVRRLDSMTHNCLPPFRRFLEMARRFPEIPGRRFPDIPGDSRRFLEILGDSRRFSDIPRDSRRFPEIFGKFCIKFMHKFYVNFM